MDSNKPSLWSRFWRGVLTAIALVWAGALWLFQDTEFAWIVFLPLFAAAPVVIAFLLVRDAVRRRRVNPLLAPAPPPPRSPPARQTVLYSSENPENAAVENFFFGVGMLFADEVGLDDLEGVHSSFHPDLQATQSAQELTELVNRNSRLFYPMDSSKSSSSSSWRGKATARLKFKIEGGTEVTAAFRLVNQDGRWQIAGYRIEDQLGGFGGGTPP